MVSTCPVSLYLRLCFFYACIHYLKSKCTCSYATLLDDNEAFAALDLNLPPEDEEWCSYVLTRILTLGSSKSKIPKIMFLCVTARPRFDEGGVCIFNGKIGCFPLVTFEHAKRSSVNRPAGTIEAKPIATITRDVIREFMISSVLPAIRARWPLEDVDKPIYILQDNAPSHIRVEHDDPQFLEAGKEDGFDIRVIFQPSNSPNFDIVDLGISHAIQAIEIKKDAKSVDVLILSVQQVHSLQVYFLF